MHMQTNHRKPHQPHLNGKAQNGISEAGDSLESLSPGDSGQVAAIIGAEALALALMEIGLYPGAEVTVIRRAPMGCPLEVDVGGSRFSIRRDTARQVSLIRGG